MIWCCRSVIFCGLLAQGHAQFVHGQNKAGKPEKPGGGPGQLTVIITGCSFSETPILMSINPEYDIVIWQKFYTFLFRKSKHSSTQFEKNKIDSTFTFFKLHKIKLTFLDPPKFLDIPTGTGFRRWWWYLDITPNSDKRDFMSSS